MINDLALNLYYLTSSSPLLIELKVESLCVKSLQIAINQLKYEENSGAMLLSETQI